MARFTIVVGHPDPAAERLNRALAERYAQAARRLGHEVRRIDVAALEFPLLRTAQEFLSQAVPPAIRQAQDDIAWADRLVFFYPLWMGDVPALFKAFIEQTFRPGFAMSANERGFPRPLLTGKSARIVVTMGMPAFAYRRLLHAHTLKSLVQNLTMCGVVPVDTTVVGSVGPAGSKRIACWLRRMEKLARADGRPPRPRRNRAILAAEVVAGSAALALGAYLSYAAIAWARFGRNQTPSGGLVDAAMPEYDVRLYHETAIDAPVEDAFAAVNGASIERSPVVQALFRARAILMGARHEVQVLPAGLPAQLEFFGWELVADEPRRELVFGAVTQPWRAKPVFRGLPAAEFRDFCEPGFAKIVLTIRIEPRGTDRCIAITETRVKTTDAHSRARFRRYWALLSPGMEIIRIVLLAQIKAAAEARVRALRCTPRASTSRT